jgi:ribose transport system ATP-binding protein
VIPIKSVPSRGYLCGGSKKSFDTNVVLSGIDLDVYEGELVALLGENGAGKSTMSSIIAGLYPPSKGTMAWEGQPYAPTRPGEAIETGIGLIHQEMRLLPDPPGPPVDTRSDGPAE